VRAKVIQQKDFGVHGDPVGFAVAGARSGIVAGPDLIQQVLIVVKKPGKAFGHNGSKRRHG
jgi:hypothetical protein